MKSNTKGNKPDNKVPQDNGIHVERVNARGKKISKKVKKPWTLKRVVLNVIVPAVLIFAVLLGGAYIGFQQYKKYLLGKIEYLPKIENPTFIDEKGSVVTLGQYTQETQNALVEESYIHNFLLIGIDSRSKNYSSDGSGSLADVIMIMSLDDNAGTIKLVAVQRDSYAYFPGYKNPQKISAAMTYGGPEFLSAVIENHLRLTLDGYAFVNFYHMEKVIDAVGGIDIEVTRNEVFTAEGGLNALLREQNHILGEPDDQYVLNDYGMLHLNGRQAVAYSRIRKVGDGDTGRSQRQIKVLNILLNKYVNMSATKQISALDDILSMIATNLTQDEIEGYVFDFLPKIKDVKLDNIILPLDGYYNEGIYSDFRQGEWSIRPDWNGMIPIVQEYLYGETYPFDPVQEIPKAPNNSSSDG